MSVMRTRLLPGLIQALRHNLNRQQSRVRLFETGLCFVPTADGLEQTARIAGVICGNRLPEGLYSQAAGQVDFFDIKGDLEAILRPSDVSAFCFQPSQESILHPGQAADVSLNGAKIGFVGGLHPAVLHKLDIDQPVFVFEVELSPIRNARLPNFHEMSRFPSIRRDIAVMVDADLPVQRLLDEIYSIKNEILQEVFVFDVYTGKEVRNNRKSVALGLILQDFSRTLVDEDVENLVTKILAQLKERCNAALRES
jgi:phenylalanyl-tRNA synthetase beta chain